MHSPQRQFVILVLAFAVAAPAVAVEPDIVRPNVWAAVQQMSEGTKVWVMFADKARVAGPASGPILQPSETPCGPRALQRRRLRRTAPGLVDERDARVPDAYVDAVRDTGATVHITSRWLNAVSATATAAQIRAISALPFVRSVQLVGRGRRVFAPEPEAAPNLLPAPQPLDATTTNLYYGSSYDQLNQINVIALHNLGYSGAGIVLGVLDTGFYKDHESIQTERILAEWDFVN
ncbi:MAG: hypothetical protein JXA69_10755, partial [Phycisphaerae bacterium]|nr:hypothetical protein [Phycisphaerae bacterium]